MKSIIVGAVVFCSLSVFADLSGTWKGSVDYKNNSGAKDNCAGIFKFDLSQPTVLAMNAGLMCTGWSWGHGDEPATYYAINNSVLNGNEQTGAISDSEITLKYVESGNKNHFSIETFRKVAADQIEFKYEIYNLDSPNLSAFFTGTLKKQ